MDFSAYAALPGRVACALLATQLQERAGLAAKLAQVSKACMRQHPPTCRSSQGSQGGDQQGPRCQTHHHTQAAVLKLGQAVEEEEASQVCVRGHHMAVKLPLLRPCAADALQLRS